MVVVFLCYTEYIDYSTAHAAIRDQYVKLICLPVDNLLPSLFANNVITFDQKKDIEDIPQKKKQMEFILDLIIHSLENDVASLYNGFLKSIQQSEDVVTRELAKKLGDLALL